MSEKTHDAPAPAPAPVDPVVADPVVTPKPADKDPFTGRPYAAAGYETGTKADPAPVNRTPAVTRARAEDGYAAERAKLAVERASIATQYEALTAPPPAPATTAATSGTTAVAP